MWNSRLSDTRRESPSAKIFVARIVEPVLKDSFLTENYGLS